MTNAYKIVSSVEVSNKNLFSWMWYCQQKSQCSLHEWIWLLWFFYDTPNRTATFTRVVTHNRIITDSQFVINNQFHYQSSRLHQLIRHTQMYHLATPNRLFVTLIPINCLFLSLFLFLINRIVPPSRLVLSHHLKRVVDKYQSGLV